MKRMFFAAILIIAISTATFAREFIASGKTHSAFGDYKIEKTDKPFTINGEELTGYIISYENSPMEVRVVITEGKNCKNYVVLSDKLSVQYVCNDNYFGVKKLDRSFRKEGISTSDEAINKSEYFHQKIIARGKRKEIENTQLIAAYFPMLIKDSNEIIAAR